MNCELDETINSEYKCTKYLEKNLEKLKFSSLIPKMKSHIFRNKNGIPTIYI